MSALQAVPDEVGLSGCRPTAGHEEIEEEVHHQQQNDDVEDLGGG